MTTAHLALPTEDDARSGMLCAIGGTLPIVSQHVAAQLVRDVEDAIRDDRPALVRLVVVGYPDVRMVQAMEQVRNRCEKAKVPLSLAVPTEMQADCAQAYGWTAPRWLVVDA